MDKRFQVKVVAVFGAGWSNGNAACGGGIRRERL